MKKKISSKLFNVLIVLASMQVSFAEQSNMGVWKGYFHKSNGFPHFGYIEIHKNNLITACWLKTDYSLIVKLDGEIQNGKIKYYKSKYLSDFYFNDGKLYIKGDGLFEYERVSKMHENCK